jgi:hypothetical protein
MKNISKNNKTNFGKQNKNHNYRPILILIIIAIIGIVVLLWNGIKQAGGP